MNFSSHNIILEKTKIRTRFKCGHFTKSGPDGKYVWTMNVTKPCRFWTEGVVSSGVAICGLLGNVISIWVLSAPQMRNTAFNRSVHYTLPPNHFF